jgi:hypothetical protein
MSKTKSNDRGETTPDKSNAAQGKSTAGMGVNKEFPVLAWNSDRSNNLMEFSRLLTNYAFIEFGNFANVLVTGEYETYAYPEPPVEAQTEQILKAMGELPTSVNPELKPDPTANDFLPKPKPKPTGIPYAIQMEIYKEELKSRQRKEDADFAKHPILFATMRGNISNGSMDLIKRHLQWDLVDKAKDPRGFWKIIRATHTVSSLSANVTDMVARGAVRQEFTQLKMRTDELLSDFVERFHFTLKKYEVCSEPLPADDVLVYEFLEKLDHRRYGQFVADLRNNEMWQSGSCMPKTLAAAAALASGYCAVSDRSGKIVGVAGFMTNVETPPEAAEETKLFEQFKAFMASTDKKAKSRGNAPASTPAPAPASTPAPAPASTNSKKNCWICNCAGHVAFFCPEKDALMKLKEETKNGPKGAMMAFVSNFCISSHSAIVTLEAFVAAKVDRKHMLILDNAAAITALMNKDLLKPGSLHKLMQGFHLTGVNSDDDDKLVIDEAGEMEEWGKAHYNPNIGANLLSQAVVRSMGLWIEYDWHSDCYWVTNLQGVKRKFVRYGMFYALNLLDQGIADREEEAMMTAAEVKGRFSSRDLIGAQRARDLQARFGHLPHSSLMRVLSSGAVDDIGVTNSDVTNAMHIYGEDRLFYKGSMTRKPQPNKPSNKSLHAWPMLTDLSCDIAFIEGHMFFISVSDFGLITQTFISSKDSDALLKAIVETIKVYRANGFTIKVMNFDGETGITALEDQLLNLGIILNQRASKVHVGLVERAIRTIKDASRRILKSLPFELPWSLLPYLVDFAVSRINMVPSKTGSVLVSPRERLTGVRTNANIHLRFAFGQMVMVPNNHGISNSMEDRANLVMAMHSSHANSGSFYGFNPTTKSIILCQQAKKVETLDADIERMNQLARLDKNKINVHEFRAFRNQHPIEDYDDEEEGLDVSSLFKDWQQMSGNFPLVPIKAPEIHTHSRFGSKTKQLATIPESDLDSGAPIDSGAPSTTEEVPAEDDGQPDDTPDDQAEDSTVVLLPAPAPVERTRRQNRQAFIPQPTTTRSGRATKPITKFGDEAFIALFDAEEETLTNAEIFQAIKSPKTMAHSIHTFGEKGREAVVAEMKQLLDKGVWHATHDDTDAINALIFVKEKTDSQGEVIGYKGRLAARGDEEARNRLRADIRNKITPSKVELFERELDKSSPTAMLASLFAVLSIAALRGDTVLSGDVVGAYLHADKPTKQVLRLNRELTKIVVELDPSYAAFVKPNGTCMVELDKALYGCLESGKLWHADVDKLLIDNGFTKNPYDPCVYNRWIDGKQTTLVLYVDDVIVTGMSATHAQETMDLLVSRYKEVKQKSGKVHEYLGMKFDFTDPGKVKVTMEGYIDGVLDNAGTTTTAKTPASDDIFTVGTSEPLEKEAASRFHTIVAKLLYLAKRVRPDILLAVSYLTTRVQAPNADDSKKLDRCLAYLNETREMGMVLEADKKLQLQVFADAAFANHPDFKGHTGIVGTLGNGPIFTSSSKQGGMAKSSTESELYAASEAGSLLLFWNNFLAAQVGTEQAGVLRQDNMSTIKLLLRGSAASKRSRHINIHNFWLKEQIENGKVVVEWTESEEMVSDILTKPLQGELFKAMRFKLLNWPDNQVEERVGG